MDVKTIYDFLRDAPEPAAGAEMILVLGSHDRRVPGYAAELYLSGSAPLLVCKPYMNRRTLATGQKQWPEVRWSIGTPDIPFEEYFPGGPTGQEVSIMVGDLFRLETYAQRGYQVPVEIPDYVRRAGERLIKAGFDRQLVR